MGYELGLVVVEGWPWPEGSGVGGKEGEIVPFLCAWMCGAFVIYAVDDGC